MASLGEAFVQIIADTSRFASSAADGVKRGMDGVEGQIGKTVDSVVANAEKRFKDVGKTLEGTGKTLSRRVTAPLVGLGVAGVKTAMDFEQSFAQIEGLVGVSGRELEVLRDAAMRLGPDFGQSSQAAADALFFITSAGLRGSDAIEVLEASLKATAVGLGDTTTIADLATSVINAYGSDTMSAARATDTLTAAVREGKLEPAELAGAMGQVLPIASAMGVSFEEVGATFAAMSRTGTDAASASTQLRGIMTSILKPTQQAEDALGEMGLSSAGLRQQIKDEGLLSVLETLTEAFEGNEIGAEQVFGNVRALSGVMDLMGTNVDGTREIFDNMTDSTGMLDDAFDVTAQTARFQFDQAMQGIKLGVVEVGNVLMPIFTDQILPMLRELGDFVVRVSERFNAMSERGQRLTLMAVGLVAALGPLLIFVGKLFRAIGFIIKPVMALFKAFGFLAKALMGLVKTVVPLLLKALVGVGKGLFVLGKIILANPLFLIAAALIALIFVFFKFRDEIMEAIKTAFEFIGNIINSVLEWVSDTLGRFADFVSDLFEKLTDAVKRIWEAFRDAIVNVFTSIRDRVSAIATNFRDMVVGVFDRIRDRIVAGVEFTRDKFIAGIEALVAGVKRPLNMLIGFANVVITGFTNMINFVGDTLRSIPSFTVPSWVPLIGGSTFSVPSFGPINFRGIPFLAEGGIVNQQTLAMIGEGGRREAVVPLDRERDPLGIADLLAGMQPSRQVTVNVYGESRPLDEERLVTLLRRSELLEGVRS